MAAKFYEMTLDEGECVFLKGYLEYAMKLYHIGYELNTSSNIAFSEPLKSIAQKLIRSVRNTFSTLELRCQVNFVLSLSAEENRVLMLMMEKAIEYFNKKIGESGAVIFCAGKYYADRIRVMAGRTATLRC